MSRDSSSSGVGPISSRTPGSGGEWLVERRAGPAAELHALDLPDDGRRHVWILEATAPAIVLGSAQRDDVVDLDTARAAGVDVVRRRSGGGAVWVAPGDPHWIDVVVPRGDPLWDDDVGRAFLPLGRAWQRALGSLGIDGTEVHGGGLVCRPGGALACFATIGPGEVLLGERKVVGISQRRTRAGARFQCAVPVRWDPAPLAALLADPAAGAGLAEVGTGIGEGTTSEQLVAALVAALDAA